MPERNLLKVNIGSGPTGRPDWVNLDWGLLAFLGKYHWWRSVLVKFRILPATYAVSWTEPNFFDQVRRFFIRGYLWAYDCDSLEGLLKNVGFTSVTRCEPGQRQVPDIGQLDIHPTGSVFVEAVCE